jgi:hypothetical protein
VRFGAALILLLAITSGAGGQQVEIRGDVLGPRPTYTAGAGLVVPFGYYVRGSADVSFGGQPMGDSTRVEWRGDMLARFLFDPFREQRWGVSVGGGLSLRRRLYLAMVADLEGQPVAGWVPAIQVGVSGGWRAGVVLRRAIADRR